MPKVVQQAVVGFRSDAERHPARGLVKFRCRQLGRNFVELTAGRKVVRIVVRRPVDP
jgi:hypothetical protein